MALMSHDHENPAGRKYFDFEQSRRSYVKLKINALDTKIISNIDFLVMVRPVVPASDVVHIIVVRSY